MTSKTQNPQLTVMDAILDRQRRALVGERVLFPVLNRQHHGHVTQVRVGGTAVICAEAKPDLMFIVPIRDIALIENVQPQKHVHGIVPTLERKVSWQPQ